MTATITEAAQTLELFVKDVKSTVLNMNSEWKENIHKNERKSGTINEKNENVSQDIEIII